MVTTVNGLKISLFLVSRGTRDELGRKRKEKHEGDPNDQSSSSSPWSDPTSLSLSTVTLDADDEQTLPPSIPHSVNTQSTQFLSPSSATIPPPTKEQPASLTVFPSFLRNSSFAPDITKVSTRSFDNSLTSVFQSEVSVATLDHSAFGAQRIHGASSAEGDAYNEADASSEGVVTAGPGVASEEVAVREWGSESPEMGLRVKEAESARRERRRKSLGLVWWKVGENDVA